MGLSLISDQQKAEIYGQVRLLAWPAVVVAMIFYVAMLVGFSHAGPVFISSVQAYFLNPPDFSKCAPLFTARLTAHIAFAHVAFLFCAFVCLVSIISRWQSGQLLRSRLTQLILPISFVLFAAVPVLSSNFLLFKAGRRDDVYHFVDFCARSWDRPALVYLLLLGFWLFYQLIAILMSIGEFVLSGHRQWSDSISSDPEVAAVQLTNRLDYGVIDQETFDETAKKLKLK